MPHRVCVYCASSQRCDPGYHADARRLGATLASRGIAIVYGGGRVGSMGALADGALACGGRVIGILPEFMRELEWGHDRLTELRIVEDMRARKHQMLSDSDGLVALPGGMGTLEELFEALTLKRLGLYPHPIVLVNTRNYFAPLLDMLDHAAREHFIGERHLSMWQVVAQPEQVPDALENATPFDADMRSLGAPIDPPSAKDGSDSHDD
jgi:uncharacterized protein (TIGR00730 family)